MGRQKGDVCCNQENFGTFMLESQAPPTGMMRNGVDSRAGAEAPGKIKGDEQKNVVF